jgi:hypothetical protein
MFFGLFTLPVHRYALREGKRKNQLLHASSLRHLMNLINNYRPHSSPSAPPQCLRKVSAYIAMQNELVYNPKGLHITDPVNRGLRVIEISSSMQGT